MSVLMPENCADLLVRAETQAVEHQDRESPERRKRTRIRLCWRLDLLVLNGTEAVQTVTRDLSSCGFYCLSPAPFVPGERVMAILKAPAHSRERPDRMLSIECQVRIVRVEPPDKDGVYGLGCEISDYKLATVPLI